MFDGQSGEALRAAEHMLESTPTSVLHEHASFEEPRGAQPWMVLVRFGEWQRILERPMPQPPTFHLVTTALAEWAKAVACAALGRVDEARAAQARFRAAVELVPSSRHVHVVESRLSLAIADVMLEGEICYREGRYPSAFEALRHAVGLEKQISRLPRVGRSDGLGWPVGAREHIWPCAD